MTTSYRHRVFHYIGYIKVCIHRIHIMPYIQYMLCILYLPQLLYFCHWTFVVFIDLVILLLGIYSPKTIQKDIMHIYVHCSTKYSSQDMEATKCHMWIKQNTICGSSPHVSVASLHQSCLLSLVTWPHASWYIETQQNWVRAGRILRTQ